MYTFEKLMNTKPRELFNSVEEMKAAYRGVQDAPSFEGIVESYGLTISSNGRNLKFDNDTALRQDGTKWLSGSGDYLGDNVPQFKARYVNNPIGFAKWLKGCCK